MDIHLDASPWGMGGYLMENGAIVSWFSTPIFAEEAKALEAAIATGTDVATQQLMKRSATKTLLEQQGEATEEKPCSSSASHRRPTERAGIVLTAIPTTGEMVHKKRPRRGHCLQGLNALMHALAVGVASARRGDDGVSHRLGVLDSEEVQPNAHRTGRHLTGHVPNRDVLQPKESVQPRCPKRHIHDSVKRYALNLIADHSMPNDQTLIGQPPSVP